MQPRRLVSPAKAFAALCLLWCAATGAARAQVQTQSPLPAPTGFVNDYANVIDPATKGRLETILRNLKERGQIEFAVVTVPTTGGRDIFDYTLAVARGWGIGPKDAEKAGLLLLVAVEDRNYRLQVSRHLEGDLPDILAGRILRERLVPPFKQGDYSRGLSDAVQAVVATLAQSRNINVEGIDQSRAYRQQPVSGARGGGQARGSLSIGALCLVAFVVIILLSMMSGGGRRGGGGGGCLNALLLANLFSNITSSGRGSSGWGGGGSSGWGGGGGGGGGFGGFGGGGDFGGGGAGGSW